jgi:uncharacterized repeat protein (TIGR03803 family)
MWRRINSKKWIAGELLLFGLLTASLARGQVNYHLLHSLGSGADGAGPWAGVTLDAQGNIYGTTVGGGANGGGTVFELTRDGGGRWSEAVLYSFANYSGDGDAPYGSVSVGGGGSLYGTTQDGGAYSFGTVFELAPDGGGGWSETILHSFDLCFCTSSPAAYPEARVVEDAGGDIYGAGHGVFELTPMGTGWFFRGLCSNGPCTETGGNGISITRSGELYGASRGDGTHLVGAVYALAETPQRGWQQYVLHNFGSYPADGSQPNRGTLAYDGKQNLYGSTFSGGANNCDGTDNACGVIYRLSRQLNGEWKETILYNFKNGDTGSNPAGGVTLDKAGNLYGTTGYGGSDNAGVVYRLSPNKNGTWTYTVLHSFNNYDGYFPTSDLAIDAQGNLYGTTNLGGAYGAGVVFEITP